MVQSVFFADIFCGRANHHPEFHLPIRMGRAAGHDHIIIGADNGGIGFEKQNGMFRNGSPGFRRVIGIIETDAEKLAYIANNRAEAR